MLTHIAAKNAKPKESMYKLQADKGLFLHIEPSGSKRWCMRYRFNGKERTLAFGPFPEISIVEAREKAYEARRLLANDVDPSARKKEQKRIASLNALNTFQAIAEEWHENNQEKWVPTHADRIMRRLRKHAFPHIGKLPIKDIKPMDVLNMLRKVEKSGATHQAHRTLQVCSSVFRYAVVTGRADRNIATDLQGALKPHQSTNYPTVEAKEIPPLLEKLEAVNANPQNKLAIRLLLLTFVRQGELRQAKWEDIDFEAKVWNLPAHTTKMRDAHIVPLAPQTIAALQELKELTGWSPYLLPAQARQKSPVISENTLNLVLHKMGYKGKLVGHGFRALASTTLNENGFKPDFIERQLAHIERNKVRAAYNRAEYLPQRREMMNWWADFVYGEVQEGAKVITGNFTKG